MLSRRKFVLGVSALALAGCEMQGALMTPPPPPEFAPIDYAARRDGAHKLSAIDPARVPPEMLRQVVAYETPHPVGSIVVDTQARLLHLVLPDGYALRYGVSVGREGFGWTGAAVVYRKASWPRWTPPPEMIERDPSLERWREGQPGGPSNPLGARALYLSTNGVDQGFRIHGTPHWRSIGANASSGCFRMLQQDVIDLFDRVPIGTPVIVI